MAKDPAVLFYTSDFLSGVSDLTMEERGQYITLLCLQHQKDGRLSRKAVAIAVPYATADVMAKFKVDENDLLYNERLEIETIKRKQHSEKQRQRAVDGWKKRKATADATALPLEDENENEIINKNIVKPSIVDIKKYTLEKGYEVDANKIWHYYNDNNWCDAKGNKVKNWKTKILNNWCKEENKSKPKYSGSKRFKVKYRSDTRYHIHTDSEILQHEKTMNTECYQKSDYND